MAEIIADRFELQGLVGSGGMGEVYRARDRVTGSTVAVKVLYGGLVRESERFQREAHLLAEVSHPRIVKYVAHGSGGAERPYLAMEWLEGEDLSTRIDRAGLSLRETLTLARGICEALAALHERGIVHRDIKPSNVYLVGGKVEHVKVLDLGVARRLHATRQSTRSGVMVGTPGYMAPEQARGAKELDARADVFALGAVLYECLAGRPAFAGDNLAALLAKILVEEPTPLADLGTGIPVVVSQLVAQMLSKHPTARPANGAVVLRELEKLGPLSDSPAQRASAPAMRALTAGERKLVCVVMAALPASPDDEPLSGYETMAASVDPRALVAGFGAEVEVLADGSLLVTMSGKGGAGDQAAQAARCALALRSHLVDAHVALATGLATLTGHSAVGEVIERAAAIVEAARARPAAARGEDTLHGQSPVFLDETTAGLLDMRFDVGGDDRGLFIRGLRERDARTRTLLGKPTPFVGRDRELTTLTGIYEECVSEPVARVVLITGQPGAGKSRVMNELVRHVRETSSAKVWIARGDPMSEGSPFGLLARAIRIGARISGAEPLLVRQEKLRSRVALSIPEPEVARVSEFLGELANVPFSDKTSIQLRAARQDSMLMGDQMRRAFCDMVVAEAKKGPLLLVLEDLHWGDQPSVGFVDSALRAAADLPFMVLAMARSEVHEVFPSLWEQRSLQEIRLGPLVRRAGERLVREVLGETVGTEDVARLLDRAAGNVFYLEELIRAFAEGRDAGHRPPTDPGASSTTSRRPISGIGAPSATGASVPPPPTSSARSVLDANDGWSLPGTVLAMVQARLERLDPMARRVLRAASVFGEVFWRGGVLALTGGEYKAAEVDAWLAELTEREIVQRREHSRFALEPEYAFHHALVRDAAYQMLTPDDRALGHRLAGEWLEQAGELEAMLLGEHFERGGAPAKAASFYIAAAAAALEGHDFTAARVRADRAIVAGARGVDLGKLHLLLAEASRWVGEPDVARSHAQSAMNELAPGSDDWFGAAAEAVEAALALGHSDDVRSIAESVRERGVATVSAAHVVATSRIAVRLVFAGAWEIAESLLTRLERGSAEIIEREPGARAFFLSARLAHAKWVGNHEDAAIFAQQAAECFDAVGDTRNAAVQRDNAGFALVELGVFAQAETMLQEAIATMDGLGIAGAANEAKLHLAQLYFRMLKEDQAVKAALVASEGFAAVRDRMGEGRARAYLSGGYHLRREHELAAREARLALELLDQTPPYRAALLGLMSLTLIDKGDTQAGIAAGEEAMRIFEEIGGTVEGESIIRIGYAESLRAKGDIEGSKKAIAYARQRLFERAAKIKNEEWRKAFLGRVAEHTRTLARAGEWLA